MSTNELPPIDPFVWSSRGEGLEREDLGKWGAFRVELRMLREFPRDFVTVRGDVFFDDRRQVCVQTEILPRRFSAVADPDPGQYVPTTDQIVEAFERSKTEVAKWIAKVAPIPFVLDPRVMMRLDVEGPYEAVRAVRLRLVHERSCENRPGELRFRWQP